MRKYLLGLHNRPLANWLALGAILSALLFFFPATAEPTTEDIRTSQQALQSLGYSPGKADGMMGARTKAAFKKFQQKEGLPVTGELDQATMHALGFPDTTAPAAPEPAADNKNSGSGGGFLFFVVLVGAVVVFALVKAGKSKPQVPANTTWTPSPTPRSAPKPYATAQAPTNASMNVYVSSAVRPAPQLSADTTASIAEHNKAVARAVADRPVAVPPIKTTENAPAPLPSKPELSADTARSIAEHNKEVAESIKGRSLEKHNKDVSAWVAGHAPSPELEAAVKAEVASMMPHIVEQPRTQLKMGGSDYFWIPASQAVTIGAFQIPNGMLYVGTKLRTQNGSVENCLIDPTQYVASSNPDTAGQTMPYWPSYSSISPQCRLAYLEWLANGKRDPGACVGYVFLYFYGLERRLILDNPGEEAAALIAEVERLLGIYGDNHSFRGYALRLIEAARFKFGGDVTEAEPVLGRRENELPLSIRAGIGRQLAEGKTINADWMLAWYAASPERYLRTAATRCEKEFVALFRRRFAAKYPDGMKITAPRRRLSCGYQAASATFSVAIQSAMTDLPDIVALSAPLTALDPLVTSCTDDLAPYSRLIGRDPESRNTVRAAALLPPDLDGEGTAAPMADLSAFLENAARSPATTLALDALLAKLDVKTTEKGRIAKADLVMMSDALARCGFAIEPYPLSAGNALNGADKVVLFKAQGGAKVDVAKPSYMAARTLIDIGALVATADGVFSEDEVHAIESEIARDPDLNATERTRLLAYLAFLSKNPPSTRILTRFKDQPPEKRQALAQLAVAVAAADGRLAPEEVKLLEKVYRTLGLAEGSLYSDLQSFAASDDDLPTVATADREPSVAIPRPGAKAETKAIRLDPARLARTRTDTAKVSAILSEVFTEDGGIEVTEATLSAAVPANDEEPVVAPAGWNLSGLAAPYARLLNALKGFDSISEAEFAQAAQKENLLAGGAIETINDWALENFDELLIDEGDPIEIAFHLLTENKQDAA